MSTSNSNLASILFGETRQRVLGWLFLHPSEKFYLREIVRHTGGAHGAVQRELETLTRAGLLRRTVKGRQVYFEADTDSPIYPELSALLTKTGALVDVLRIGLEPVGAKILAAFVYGSAARGEMQSQSDIDLLIVGHVGFSEVVAALAQAQERLGREVNPTLYSPVEFIQRMQERNHFLLSLRTEKRLFVMGGDHELSGLAPQWLAHETRTKPKRNQRTPQSN
jgi:predicted nucleotidyltransferase